MCRAYFRSKDTQIMQGLGDLISTEKEKHGLRAFKADTIFLLKNYIRARFIY